MKKSVVIFMLLVLCLFAGGCAFGGTGSASAADSGSMSAPAAISYSADSAKPAVSSEVQGSSAPQTNSLSAPAVTSDSGNAAKPEVSSEVQVNSAQATESRAAVDGIDEKYLSGIGDIEMIVLEARADGFTGEGGVPEFSADGQIAAVAAAQKADVVYTAETVFLLLEYTRATEESTVRRASADDVKAGSMMAVWGGFDNDKFIASVVRVFVPV